MYKKVLGMFLMGALFFFYSCVDDTYDLNKDITTDVAIKGNRLTLPLGSLRPMTLDSLLVDSMLESIPSLKIDKETRSYSLSLNDSLKTGVNQEDLEALKKVSELSANIDPISISIDEISFDPEAYSLSKELDFGEVDLSKITLNEIKPDPIILELDELTLDPITIPGEKEPRSVEFNIPTVSLNNIFIGGGEAQKTNLNINDINLEDVRLSDINETISIGVTKIDINKTPPPTFSHTQPLTLSDNNLNSILSKIPGGDNAQIPSSIQTISIDTKESKEESYTVDIDFSYDIPEQVNKIDSVILDPETSEINFVLKNPELVINNPGLNPTLDFHIVFPKGYVLSEEPGYTLSDNRNEISATIPISGEKTNVIFHLEKIEGLSDKIGNGKIYFADKVTCTIKYKVGGDVTIQQGTTIGEVKQSLNYSFGLDVAFNVEKAYGSINPVESDFTTQYVPFSFSLENLDYIKAINTVKLKDTKLQFSMGLNEGFEHFNIADDSKLVISFPSIFRFSTDGMQLPDGVEKRDNDFEITNFAAFNTTKNWILPISEIEIEKTVDGNGKLDFSTQASVKAVTGNKENRLSVKGTENIDLIAAVNNLCGTERNVTLKADNIVLNIEDVKGATNIIDIEFDKQVFDFDFEVAGNLEHISHIDFVEFESTPITIVPSVGDLGNIQLEFGSGIAIRFPEKFEFDTTPRENTLRYDETLRAFVIENLSQLEAEEWNFYLQKIYIDKDVDGTLSFDEEVILEAINGNAPDTHLHIAGNNDFSLMDMRQGLLNEQGKELSFAIKRSPIVVKEVQLDSKDINIDFPSPDDITYPISIQGLKYITHIGSIEFKEEKNVLEFSTLSEETLDRFKLAKNSYIELKFPKEFKLDSEASDIPQEGASFADSSTIQITSLEALNYDWKLAVKRIALDKDIEKQTFEQDYAIKIASYNSAKEANKLTIAAIEDLKLTDIKDGEIKISVKDSEIEIADVEVSIENIGIDFEEQPFVAPIPTIENLDLIKEIKYISFEENKNIVNLNISLDGDLGDFDLVDSKVKLNIPSEFELDVNKCNFDDFEGELEYIKAENAIYINSIQSIISQPIQLAIKQIDIYQTIVDNKFDWDVNFSVSAISNEPNKLYVGCKDNNLRFSEISPIMGDKTIQIHVEEADLSIYEAIVVSNGVTEKIEEKVGISLKETIAEAIDRVDSIGFDQPVPMTLSISTKGLENLTVPVNILADITFPPVFDITSNDDNIIVTEQGLHIDTEHSFKESQKIEFKLLVNNLDFTTLECGHLALIPDDNGGRVLEYTDSAAIKGTVSIADATVSSEILEGISLDINFDMEKAVLKDFTGIYGGTIDPVSSSFELELKNSFEELEKNGLTLTNTKPELMITLNNSIGIPVDVELAIFGIDDKGDTIPTAVVKPTETLRIRPAQFNDQNVLVPETTCWFFTSNKDTIVNGYEVVWVENLDNLLEELPEKISFDLKPTIVTEDKNGAAVIHHVDLSNPLELNGSYSISVPFDLQFTKAIPLDFGEEADDIIRDDNNKFTLANPQLALSIHNPIAEELAFDLSLIGKDAGGQNITTATLFENEPFVLAAGHSNEDGSITPVATRWLFAVNDTIKKEGYETKVASALSTLLVEIPHQIDIELNAHFNTDLVKKIDYNNDLELLCEYDVMVPLQFDNLELTYTDTIADIQFNLDETLDDLGLSISNVGLAIAMNLKNTLPVGLKLELTPLDAQGNAIKDIKISSIEIPAGNGSDINSAIDIKGTPVELAIQCESPSALSKLDKVSFNLEVSSGNGDNALTGKQGLQICDIVLQIMCDVEIDASK